MGHSESKDKKAKETSGNGSNENNGVKTRKDMKEKSKSITKTSVDRKGKGHIPERLRNQTESNIHKKALEPEKELPKVSEITRKENVSTHLDQENTRPGPKFATLEMQQRSGCSAQTVNREFEPTKLKRKRHGDIYIKTNTDTQDCFITSSTIVNPNYLVLVDQNNHKIKLVDLWKRDVVYEMECVSSLAKGITSVSDVEVAVTLYSANQSCFIQVHDKQLQESRRLKVNGGCYGICYVDRALVVSFIDPLKVELMSLEGEILRTFQTFPDGTELFSRPTNLTAIPGVLFVSDSGKQSIVKIDLSTYKIRIYHDGNELKHTNGITPFKRNKLLICSWTEHKILEMDMVTGDLENVLSKDDGVMGPETVSYCEATRTLYVGCVTYVTHIDNYLSVYEI